MVIPPNRSNVLVVRIVRAICLPVLATVFVMRSLFEAYRVSRQEHIGVGEALDRQRAELQAEADEEANREEWRRNLFEGMPPPP